MSDVRARWARRASQDFGRKNARFLRQLMCVGLVVAGTTACSAPQAGLDPRVLVQQSEDSTVSLSGWFADGVSLMQTDACAAAAHWHTQAPLGAVTSEVLLFSRLANLAATLCQNGVDSFALSAPADGTLSVIPPQSQIYIWEHQVYVFDTDAPEVTLVAEQDLDAISVCGATWVSQPIEIWPVNGLPVVLQAPDNGRLMRLPAPGTAPVCPPVTGAEVTTGLPNEAGYEYRLIGNADDPPGPVRIGSYSPGERIVWNGLAQSVQLTSLLPDTAADAIYYGCPGYVTAEPSLQIFSEHYSDYLVSVRTYSDLDTVMVIRNPDGSMLCDDDGSGDLNAMLQLELQPGVTDVWFGTYGGGALPSLTVEVF